ncbi:MAG: hypothetical protein ACXWLH_03940 [Candidatus Saccharimonadales bacterium]
MEVKAVAWSRHYPGVSTIEICPSLEAGELVGRSRDGRSHIGKIATITGLPAESARQVEAGDISVLDEYLTPRNDGSGTRDIADKVSVSIKLADLPSEDAWDNWAGVGLYALSEVVPFETLGAQPVEASSQ